MCTTNCCNWSNLACTTTTFWTGISDCCATRPKSYSKEHVEHADRDRQHVCMLFVKWRLIRAVLVAGGSDQALLGFNPIFGRLLHHQHSNASQEDYIHTGQPLQLGNRHQTWSDNPLLDDRFASTPMVADQIEGNKHRADPNSSFQHSPFSRADSNRAVFDALPRMGAQQLSRLGSGQIRSGMIPYGLGLSRLGSGPGQLRSGLSHQGSGLQYKQEPVLATDDSASGHTVVLHGAHSLLEHDPYGMLNTPCQFLHKSRNCVSCMTGRCTTELQGCLCAELWLSCCTLDQALIKLRLLSSAYLLCPYCRRIYRWTSCWAAGMQGSIDASFAGMFLHSPSSSLCHCSAGLTCTHL